MTSQDHYRSSISSSEGKCSKPSVITVTSTHRHGSACLFASSLSSARSVLRHNAAATAAAGATSVVLLIAGGLHNCDLGW